MWIDGWRSPWGYRRRRWEKERVSQVTYPVIGVVPWSSSLALWSLHYISLPNRRQLLLRLKPQKFCDPEERQVDIVEDTISYRVESIKSASYRSDRPQSWPHLIIHNVLPYSMELQLRLLSLRNHGVETQSLLARSLWVIMLLITIDL